jgi:hypothetical protein
MGYNKGRPKPIFEDHAVNDSRFTLHRRALLAYSTLTRPERDALETVLAPLAGQPEERWRTAGATRLESAEPLYVVRVDDSLRAIIHPTPGGPPEVLDLVRHETLERFFKE